MEHPRTTRAAAVLALTATMLAAACGGGGGDAGSSDPSSNQYDPAKTTLEPAGLEVCSDASSGVPQNLGSGQGVITTRAFFVASDCQGSKTSPDTVVVL